MNVFELLQSKQGKKATKMLGLLSEIENEKKH